MIDATFLKAAAELGNKARIVICEREPSSVYYTVDESGTMIQRVAKQVENNRLESYDAAAIAYRNANEYSTPELWYSAYGLTLVHCNSDRRDRSAMSLRNSAPFNVLKQWSAKIHHAAKQPELYLLLRTTFRDCLPAHPALMADIGRVDIKKVQEASGVISRSKVSMDRGMIAEASGAASLPEVLNFKVPFWANHPTPFSVSVRAAFELDPQSEEFRISILPGEIENAELLAADEVRRKLAQALVSHDQSTADVVDGLLIHGVPS